MLEALTLVTFCTLYKVLSQALDHKLVHPVDCSSQPLKHLLLGAVDLKQAMEPRLLSPVELLHLRDLGLTHDDLPPDGGGQPPPRPTMSHTASNAGHGLQQGPDVAAGLWAHHDVRAQLQLPGEFAQAFNLETLSPRHCAMMCEARLSPLMEGLPDVSIILSSLILATHYIDFTLQLPLLCVMMSVVTMMMTLPPPLTPHASPLPKWQWPGPASQPPPVTAPWAGRINQRMDGKDALMLALMTHIIFYTMYKVFSQAQDHELVLPVDVSGQPLKHSLLGAVDLKQRMNPTVHSRKATSPHRSKSSRGEKSAIAKDIKKLNNFILITHALMYSRPLPLGLCPSQTEGTYDEFCSGYLKSYLLFVTTCNAAKDLLDPKWPQILVTAS